MSNKQQQVRFDSKQLYEALNAKKNMLGISWQQMAVEIGVSASTLTYTKKGGRMEVNGMLAMVRWLGRSVESFTKITNN